MQITKAEVIPMVMNLKHHVQLAGLPVIDHVTAIFVRMETRQGQSAWGCTVVQPGMSGQTEEAILKACYECASLAPDLHPYNIEYSLAELSGRVNIVPEALCAFDLAFYDLLSIAADMPLYRILGGYRNRIQTSATIPISNLEESVEQAREKASDGFRMLKIKGGIDPEEDVHRVQAIHQMLPEHILRLDADGGYTVQEALDVSRALEGILEMLEQPVKAPDLPGLRQVTEISPVRILADQSVTGPSSALEIAASHCAHGMSIKLASCGGLHCARQIDAIARAARLATMVSCFIEPALLVAAGLSFALSSPNVQYGDLDGNLDLVNDPSKACFRLEAGWLTATDTIGLGYSVELS